MNVAFQCYFLTNQPSKCIDILIKSKKLPEAALFARTYLP
jgi:coatomer subunit beta'